MFYFLAVISMVGYGAQVSLLGHLSRKMNALDISFYRNASFVITLLPLLFFTSFEEISVISNYLGQLTVMGFTAVMALWASFASYKYLPIGVSQAVNSVIKTILIFILGLVFFGELLTIPEAVLITMAIASAIYLGNQKNHMPHLDAKTFMGFVFVLLSAVPAAVTIFLAADLAREINPFVAGYFWEASIALASAIVLFIRYLVTSKKPEWVGWKHTKKIALAAWPTFIGTGAFALAVSLGPIVIVSGIGLASTVVAALMAHYIFHEKLNQKQWIGIIMTLLAIAALKFV